MNASVDRAPGRSAPTPASRNWMFWVVVIVFGVLFTYDLIEAISDLLAVPMQIRSYNTFLVALGLEPGEIPWVPLIVNTLLPAVGFALAFVVALRQRVLVGIAVFAAALAAVAALTLTMNVLGGIIAA